MSLSFFFFFHQFLLLLFPFSHSICCVIYFLFFLDIHQSFTLFKQSKTLIFFSHCFLLSKRKRFKDKMPVDRTSHLIAPVAETVRRRSFYRSFVQFLCSNLGLILVVIGYSIGGAFLFQLLEQYIELQNCQQGSCKSFSNLNLFIQIYLFYFLK